MNKISSMINFLIQTQIIVWVLLNENVIKLVFSALNAKISYSKKQSRVLINFWFDI